LFFIFDIRLFYLSFGIAPWNGPFALAIRAVAVPIVCGNTAVLKGSESTPGTQALVAELFEEAGLPAGVLNILSISRENAPALTAEIIAHPAVRHINVRSTLFSFSFYLSLINNLYFS